MCVRSDTGGTIMEECNKERGMLTGNSFGQGHRPGYSDQRHSRMGSKADGPRRSVYVCVRRDGTENSIPEMVCIAFGIAPPSGHQCIAQLPLCLYIFY